MSNQTKVEIIASMSELHTCSTAGRNAWYLRHFITSTTISVAKCSLLTTLCSSRNTTDATSGRLYM